MIGNYSSTDYLYHTDHATWCVKAATKTPSWRYIFFIFSNFLWLAHAAVFLIMIIAIYIYIYINDARRRLFWALMCTIKINIGFNPGFYPKRVMGRIIFLIFLIYGLIVSALFQSATVSTMTGVYYQTQINSLNEAFENDFYFAGSNLTYTILSSRKDRVNLFHNFFFLFRYNALFFLPRIQNELQKDFVFVQV